MSSGIYQIVNLLDGKIYTGQSVNIEQRIYNHKCLLRRNIKPANENSHLWNSFNKYGEENFEFRIVIYCEQEFLDQLEDWYDSRVPRNLRYNSRPISTTNKGIEFSEEHREKLRQAKLGYKRPPEVIAKISKNLDNRKSITQYDEINGDILNKYPSIIEASIATGISTQRINRVLNRGKESTAGYIFKYN